MYANRVRAGLKAFDAWKSKKKEMRKKLKNSMNAAYKRGNNALGDKKRAQLNKL